MDRQNREGGKTGSAHGLLTAADQHAHRRRRLLRLAMDTADLSADPYAIRNHLGQWECVLCMTVHTNEGSYLAHTAAKKHQANLARRAAREAQAQARSQQQQQPVQQTQQHGAASVARPRVTRIGRPLFDIKRFVDSEGRFGMTLHVHYPNILASNEPAFRIMSAFEQRLEAPNRAYQYLLVAGEPYETVAFKVPNWPVLQDPSLFFAWWDSDFKVFTVQVIFERAK